MKVTLKYLFAVPWLALAICGCKDSVTNPQSINSSAYFKLSGTNYFKYRIEVADTLGVAVESGTRSISESNKEVRNGLDYITIVDSLRLKSTSSISKGGYKKDFSGVFVFADTSTLFAGVPDSVKPFLICSTSINLLNFPIQTGKVWSVFNAQIHSPFYTSALVIINAEVIANENIMLNLINSTSTINSFKVRYTAKLDIPDPNNIQIPIAKILSADIWFGENVGVVKAEGSGLLLNLILNGRFFYEDLNTRFTQNLTVFKVE